DIYTVEWSTHEWLHFIRHLPLRLSEKKMVELDAAFQLTESGNSEILAAWLLHVVNNKYEAAYPELENFLVTVGRRKFLTPLYKAMAETDEGLIMAKEIYTKARPNYHSVSVGTIDAVLDWK
ncbi:MAG: leukotriene A4 hydrolase C-terminal domain-containing protein, partial [Bacteroidetes bacterium]|nr:leukotriene A4 hydrolase C-terminal domain-containing protein [Bacteroidota bacterium]